MNLSDQPKKNSRRSYVHLFFEEKTYGLCLGVIAVFLSLHLAIRGAPPQVIFGHDSILLYDGGWRVFHGLKPSADFYSPLGPVTYLFVAAGYWLFGVNVDSLAYMEAISLPFMMAVVWYSLKTRMTWFWLFWSAALIALCLVAQHPPRQTFWHISYAMLYNRIGYGWIMTLALLLFSPQGTASKLRLRINSIEIGAILSLLFFIKVSFLIAAIPLLLTFLCLRGKAPLPLMMIGWGFLGSTALFLAYLNFDLSSILRDLSIAAEARSQGFQAGQMVVDLFRMRWQILIAGVLAVATSSPKWPTLWDRLILCAAILASSFIIFETNSPYGLVDELPLFPVLLILLSLSPSDLIPRDGEGFMKGAMTAARNFWLVTALISINLYLLPDAASILCAAYLPGAKRTWPLFAADPMKRLILLDNHSIVGFSYADKINDGFRLLRENELTGLSCAALDFTSPFSFALKTPPPEGFPTFWQVGYSVSKTSYPNAQEIFRGLEVVLVPKLPEDPPETTVILKEVYHDYLAEHYTVVTESAYWTLLKRR